MEVMAELKCNRKTETLIAHVRRSTSIWGLEKHFSPEFNLIARLMSVPMNMSGQTNGCHWPFIF